MEALARRPDEHYFHYKYGIKAIPGTFVLFQYRNAIIACATFKGATRFKELDERGHAGVMYFEPMTVRVFEPIFLEGMNVCWPDFKGFSNVKQVLSPEGYGRFQKMLRNIRRPDFRSY